MEAEGKTLKDRNRGGEGFSKNTDLGQEEEMHNPGTKSRKGLTKEKQGEHGGE